MQASHSRTAYRAATETFVKTGVRQPFSLTISNGVLLLLLLLAIGCGETSPPIVTAEVNQVSPVESRQQRVDGGVEIDNRKTFSDVASVEEETGVGEIRKSSSSAGNEADDSSQAQRKMGDDQIDPQTQYLIVHADDAGMCHSVNRGTIEALEAGVVTSASIMVPCPGFDEFAHYAHAHPEFDYGIHLTLNAEFEFYRWGPVLPQDEVPSLVDGGGKLWRSEHEVAGNARSDDVERELRAQIDKALAAGIRLTHLDSHMGTLFMRPDLLEIYVRLGIEYDLPVLVPRDTSFLQELGLNEDVISQLDDTIDALVKHGLPVVDRVLMHYRVGSVSRKKRAYTGMIRSLPAGVSEIIIHCGYADSELRSITRSSGIRDGDRRVFTDSTIIREVRNSGVRLITWKQFHEMFHQRVLTN